jgi:DNA polymerase III subunit beta
LKFTTKAGEFARSLALMASVMHAIKKGSSVVRMAATPEEVSITCSDHHMALIIRISASVVEPGECALAADRLAALVAGFAANVQLAVSSSDTGTTVGCGSSNYRLPVIPLTDMPTALALDHTMAEIEIGGEDVLLLLEPLYAAAKDQAQYSFGGLFLHSVNGQLASVATDGVRLCRVSIPAADFSPGRDLILPTKPATTLRRIVTQMKPHMVKVRRSRTLIAFSGGDFEFTSRLLDSSYSNYEAIIPVASANVITCARAELRAALGRLAAVANTEAPPLLALCWTHGGPLCLTLARQPGDATDLVNGIAHGSARLAVSLTQFMEVLNDFRVESIRFEASAGPLVIQPDGLAQKLALLVPSRWNFEGGVMAPLQRRPHDPSAYVQPQAVQN